MRISRAEKLRRIAERLAVLVESLLEISQEIDAIVMKKTTQNSPEFRGASNC
jgi:hypothetical protein